ncbi:MAG: peptide chain release factor N(5)-glutamine methyltransferase [Alphaproteobacteria bacterium]
MSILSASPASVGDAVHAAAAELRRAGIKEAAILEARLLVAHALGVPKDTVFSHPERGFDDPAAERLRDLLHRRARREPISHLLEKREFWSLPFRVTPATFDPRPDSETLITTALEHVHDRKAVLRVLDLGTGSGCLLLALLSELPEATGLGIDLSEAALAVARSNANALGLQDRARFVRGDWGEAICEKFDLILSNPPYIPDSEIGRLQPEIALYESPLALKGGEDGLACYRVLAPHLHRLLRLSGAACLEVGDGQAEAVMQILIQYGFKIIGVQEDLRGIPRCVIGRL